LAGSIAFRLVTRTAKNKMKHHGRRAWQRKLFTSWQQEVKGEVTGRGQGQDMLFKACPW
jgi:hypothetical protein